MTKRCITVETLGVKLLEKKSMQLNSLETDEDLTPSEYTDRPPKLNSFERYITKAKSAQNGPRLSVKHRQRAFEESILKT